MLHIILGNAGSGKSTYIYSKITKEAKAHMRQAFLVLVPEQYTMETQRRMVEFADNSVIMNTDVLSFNRLAYRVFTELNINTSSIIDDTGKNFLLRKIASQKAATLQVLGKKITRPGYITQMKSVISELIQYDISPADFSEMLKLPGGSVAFAKKGEDINTMYTAFLEEMDARNLCTQDTMLSTLAGCVKDSNIIKDSTIVLDGFTGLTPVQYHLLEELLKVAKDVYVSVTIDINDNFTEANDYDLFYMSKTYINRLRECAAKVKCPIDDIYKIPDNAGRLKDNEVLSFLEKNIFKANDISYSKNPTDNLMVFCQSDPKEELIRVAIEISKLVRTKGVAHSDCAIVASNLEAYRYYATDIFPKYGIPIFIDQKTNIVYHPLLEAVDSILEMLSTNYSIESVFRFLKTGLSGLTFEQIALFENYCLATRFRGEKKYSKLATVPTLMVPAQRLEEINAIRERIYLGKITSAKGSVHSVEEYTAFLKELIIEKYNMPKLLTEIEAKYRSSDDEIKAREYSQVMDILIDLLDRLESILGSDTMTVEEYKDILRAGIEASSIGVIPPAKDCVMMGDIQRTRLDGKSYVFIVGCDDTKLPAPFNHGGILSQSDREFFLEHNIELAPSDRQRAYNERFYMYMLLTKPSKKLVITYANSDADGATVRPSYLVSEIKRLFSGIGDIARNDFTIEEQLYSINGAEEVLAVIINKIKRTGYDSLSFDEKEIAPILFNIVSAEYTNKLVENKEYKSIDPEVLKVINEELTGSISKFESYAQCPFAYFSNYVLKLKEAELPEFTSIDIGNFYHNAMEYIGNNLLKEDLSSVDNTKIETVVEKAFEEAMSKLNKTNLLMEGFDRLVLEQMKHAIWRNIKYIIAGIIDDELGYVPKDFEKRVYPEIKDINSDDIVMKAVGKIDRVDIAQVGDTKQVRIIDYKTSPHDIDLNMCYEGISMQLPIYMSALLNQLNDTYEPGAMMYYDMYDGFIKEDDKDTHFTLKGIPNDKKASKEDLKTIMAYENYKAATIAKQIKEGKFEALPYAYGNSSSRKTGCKYCSYNPVCGFNEKNGDKYRECGKIPDVLDQMRNINGSNKVE